MSDTRATIYLLILGAIWGGSFLFMKVAAPEFGVFALVEIRTMLATLVLLPFLMKAGGARSIVKHWQPILAVGAANTAIPFVLFNYSSLHLDAGVNAILNATAPMFGALVAVIWLKESLSKMAIAGLALGFVGVVVISASKVITLNMSLLPVFTALLATLGYGLAACMMKKWLTGTGPLAVATGSQLFASILLLPFSVMTWPAISPSLPAWWSAIALAVAGTGIAYLLYFYLIANIGPARAITVAYLVPLFGVVWGAIFLSESLSLATMLGGFLILIGVYFTSGNVKLARQKKTNQ